MAEKFRYVFIPKLGDSNIHDEEFATKEQAFQSLQSVAKYTLSLHEFNLMPDHSNTGWVEQLIDGEWEECSD